MNDVYQPLPDDDQLKAQLAEEERRGMERAMSIACDMVGGEMWSKQTSYRTRIYEAICAAMEKKP